MPAYNEAKYLAKTIECVLAQTYPAVELIISDNHSTDGTSDIIAHYMARHVNIQLWAPAEHCDALDHFFFMWAKLKNLNYDFFIHTGGHDWIDSRYVDLLLQAKNTHPSASIICGRGLALDKVDHVLGEYSGKTPGLQGPYTIFNPFSIILMTSSNVAIHGLMSADIVRSLDFRYKCPAVDVMFIAEASIYGDVVYVPDAVFYQRISGTNTADYLKKHMGVAEEDTVSLVRVMNLQFQYLSEVADVACASLPPPFRRIYKAALMGAYYVKWCSADHASGTLLHIGPLVEKFLADMERTCNEVEGGLETFFGSTPN